MRTHNHKGLQMGIAIEKHCLHKIVGDLIYKKFDGLDGVTVKKDFECCNKNDPREQLPLFSSLKDQSRITQLCKVDMLIIANDKVKVIVEIEESGMIPTKICGKFLTSGLAQCYRSSKQQKCFPLSDKLLFIQVLSSKKIPKRSSIEPQWESMENVLKSIKNIKGRKMSYRLISWKPDKQDKEHAKELFGHIETFLKCNS